MRPKYSGPTLLALTVLGAVAQTGAIKPAFEVASIKPSNGGPRKAAVAGDRLDFSNFTLKDLILHAYKVEAYQLRAPQWAESRHFSIVAKLPAGATKENVPSLLQTLIEDRFRMKVHHETKPQPVYALVIAKGGPKLKKAEDKPEAKSGTKATPSAGPQPPVPGSWVMRMVDSSTVRVTMPRATMLTLTRFLSDKVHRPVIDETGLTGEYDIVLDGKVVMVEQAPSTGGVAPPPPPAPPTSMDVSKTIQDLGLRLEPRTAPVDFLVVDSAEKTPIGN
jgi:uncharacterized protein (TIGR03435 family)